MRKFIDRKGRTWRVDVTVYGVKRVKEETGVEIGKLLENEAGGFDKLFSDLSTVADVLYVLCEKQAKKRRISDREFGESLCGDSMLDAGEALAKAIADFFPSLQRELILNLWAASTQDHSAVLTSLNHWMRTQNASGWPASSE